MGILAGSEMGKRKLDSGSLIREARLFGICPENTFAISNFPQTPNEAKPPFEGH